MERRPLLLEGRDGVAVAIQLTGDAGGSAGDGRRLVPVLTDEGATGLVTTREQLLEALARDADLQGSSTVADVCVPSPVTLRPDDTLRRAAYLFAEHGVTQAPVVGHGPDAHVVGTVTLHHLLHARRHDLTEEHHRQRLLPGSRRRDPDAVPT
ncbi:CBS domain-containing protein [Streptomyces sp. CB02959]|uniref:CBS domain-containing protein n=2 Tax=unclassified Streptomyces TaxID=2593676 RepID=UPI002152BDA3|nr:CBS domain-containing protein [Streptomyces sp. CB02959]